LLYKITSCKKSLHVTSTFFVSQEIRHEYYRRHSSYTFFPSQE